MSVQPEQIRADIKKFVEIYCKAGARIASEEFTRRAEDAIMNFYLDYSPTWYDRTYNMLENSYSKWYKNNSNIIYGGVKISSDKMGAYPPRKDTGTPVPGKRYPYGQSNPDSILYGVWEVGDRVTAKASASPLWELRKTTVDNYQLITSIKRRAMQEACSAGYSVIQPYMK